MKLYSFSDLLISYACKLSCFQTLRGARIGLIITISLLSGLYHGRFLHIEASFDFTRAVVSIRSRHRYSRSFYQSAYFSQITG